MTSEGTDTVQLGKPLFQSFKDILKVIPLAALLALAYTAVRVPLFPIYPVHLSLSAASKMNVNAKAPVVWLKQPQIQEFQKNAVHIYKTMGWERPKGFFISSRLQPAELVLIGCLRKQTDLIFDGTPYSGIVEIEVDRNSKDIDLYRTDLKPVIFRLSDQLKTSRKAWGRTARILTFDFFSHFLPLLIFLRLIYPFYAALPEPSVKQFASNDPDRKNAKRILALFAVVVFALYSVAFFPGVMTPDAYAQYYQAISSEFHDWYPPTMAALWTITDEIIPGAGGQFLLYLFMTVLSVYLLSIAAFRKEKKLYFLPLILLFLPFVSNMLNLVIKDTAMAMSLLLAFSAWYFWRMNGTLSKSKLGIIFILLFYGISVRYNALPAALPLILIIFLDLMPKRMAIVSSVLVMLLIYFGNGFMSYYILKADKNYTFQALMAHDLMGVYKITGKNYFPAAYLDQSKLDRIMIKFLHTTIDSTINKPETPLTADASKLATLKQQWLKAVREEPSAYLKHRWLMFSDLLRSSLNFIQPTSLPPPSFMQGNRLPLIQETRLGHLHSAYVIWAEKWLHFLFIPLTYVLACSGIFLLALRKRMLITAALSSSALLYIATYFVGAPATDFRYSYWSILATLLAIYTIWMNEKEHVIIESKAL